MKPQQKMRLHILIITMSTLFSSLQVYGATTAVIPFFTEKKLGGIEIVTSTSGRVWMDRNLGAQRPAFARNDLLAFGGYFQWGRDNDGHAWDEATIPTTTVKGTTDTPDHGMFILASTSPWDWREPSNSNLWQGVTGVNNPCPKGFRLPTETEWQEEIATWSSNTTAGAFNSPLKLPASGNRSNSSGALGSRGTTGYYWSSTVDGNMSKWMIVISFNARTESAQRAFGCSVRCIKD